MNQTQTKRLFLGFAVDKAAKTPLIDLQAVLRPRLNDAAVPIVVDNFHLTLIFLGKFPTHEVPKLIAKVDLVPKSTFSQPLYAIDFWSKPAILCLSGAACQPLKRLAQQIRSTLASDLAWVPSTLAFTPHISLFRKATTYDNAGFCPDKLELTPDKLHLYESVSQAQSGSMRVQYHVLHSWELS